MSSFDRYFWGFVLLTAAVIAPWQPAPVAAADADHLLLSEVVVRVRPQPLIGSQFIEIVNPTAVEIPLGDVYLTDATAGPSVYYYNIVTYSQAGGGTGGDFHCRFPNGAVIAAGDTIVVAIKGSDEFEAAFGRLPDFELYEDDSFAPDGIADMVEAFPGSIGAGLAGGANSPELSETAESVVLYRWDRQSDLVEDLDYLVWGTISTVRASKSGVVRDGPDPDTDPTAYATDTEIGAQQPVASSAHGFAQSFQRISFDEGAETLSGGNGITGHDETSEPLAATWLDDANQEPATSPTVPFPSAPLVMDVVLDPSAPYTDMATSVTVSLLSFAPVTAVSLTYKLDGGRDILVAATDNGDDTWTAMIPDQAEGTAVAWFLSMTGGGASTYPVTAPALPAGFVVSGPPPPLFSSVNLSPPAPYTGVATSITASIGGIDPLVGVDLFYSLDAGAFVEVACQDAGGGDWNCVIPVQPTGTVVDWYLRAEGSGGGISYYPEGAPATPGNFTVTDEPEPVDAPVHLLITEVCVLGAAGEFVEIVNRSGDDVILDNYYLADANYAPNNQYYWNIVRPNPSSSTIGGGVFNDFSSRFPAGEIIGAGDTITVAVAGSGGFAETYQFMPTYELYEDGTSADAVPDMRPVFDGSIVGESTPTLTNGSEMVVLYYWDGQSDLVTDIDVFMWGSLGSNFFSKNGVSIDGPDPDSSPSTYQPETVVSQQSPFSTEHAFGESYQRVDPEEDGERPSGGNGVGGHDEVSEIWADSWRIAAVDPARPPMPDVPGGGNLDLKVPGRTFLPLVGESFPVQFFTKPQSRTVVRIYDLEGRLVRTLFDSAFDGFASTIPGQYDQVSWDGRDEEFQLVPAGFYVVHLSVIGRETGDVDNMTAPVVVATRLSR